MKWLELPVMTNREVGAALIGFGMAIFIPPLLLALLGPLNGSRDPVSILGSMMVLLPFSLLAVVLLGVPAFFLLRPFRPGNWWLATLVGVVLGIAVACILRLPSAPDPHMFWYFAPVGGVATLVFWLIWKRSLPPPSVA